MIRMPAPDMHVAKGNVAPKAAEQLEGLRTVDVWRRLIPSPQPLERRAAGCVFALNVCAALHQHLDCGDVPRRARHKQRSVPKFVAVDLSIRVQQFVEEPCIFAARSCSQCGRS